MRRAPDYFVPRSFLSLGNSEERLEPGSGGRGAGEASAAPPARPGPVGWPGGRAAGDGASPVALRLPPSAPPSPPPFRGLQWKPRGGGSRPRGESEFPRPPSGPVGFFPPRHLVLLRPTGPPVCGCPRRGGQPSAPLAAQAEAGRTCLEGVRGSPRGHARPMEGKGWRGAGFCVGAGGSLRLLRACVLPFVPRRPRWMRCDRGVQAWAVQIKSC